MPVTPLAVLQPGSTVVDVLESMRPGMVLGTGQFGSGKLTTLLALTQRHGGDGGAVTLLSDQLDHFASFHPLPPNWSEVLVKQTPDAWTEALDVACASGALLVVAPLDRQNAQPTFRFAADRWVFATIETVMVGLDTSYALREMGVGYDCFADAVRCVWSQVLVEALCDDCGVEAGAPSAEAQAAGVDVHAHIKREAGCPRCDGRGTKGLVAISDVTLLPDELREGVRSALVKGIEFPLRGELRASALQQARAFLGRGTIGINTFQDLVRRNPILRSQGALERAELQLNMLTALANRTLAGVIVVGADQQVRFANACAHNALVRTTDLCIEDRRLTPAPTVARAFAAGLAAAVAEEPRATRLALNVDGGDSRNVFIAPLPSAWNMDREGQRLALIVLGGARSAEILPNARDLRQYFDLTPAESNVALLLCAGLVPKGIARKLNVSLPTVRSHLRALLDKTGTARQSELLSLLSSLPSTTATLSR